MTGVQTCALPICIIKIEMFIQIWKSNNNIGTKADTHIHVEINKTLLICFYCSLLYNRTEKWKNHYFTLPWTLGILKSWVLCSNLTHPWKINNRTYIFYYTDNNSPALIFYSTSFYIANITIMESCYFLLNKFYDYEASEHTDRRQLI